MWTKIKVFLNRPAKEVIKAIKDWWLDKPCLFFLCIGVVISVLPWYMGIPAAGYAGYSAAKIDKHIKEE